MKSSRKRISITIGILFLFAMSLLSSCASRKYQTEWMDVAHAKRLDKKKGHQSRKIQRNAHNYPKSTKRHQK
ncbi:hypothetical protein [Reichenbachiella ulvae]|uniref:Lipoprotein n=1 Tax=Reichenbachiella ulvae TaxID=2980104 RepID=A0ABT3CN53_9BACT|nr:hypothetical protein [Reichenbachiella ulvae]MCV9385086.1 hypothetical protein [Reichenbachiella ulvae]